MTDILIKDISARIPYGVRCQCANDKLTATIIGIKFHNDQCFVELDYKDFIGIVKVEKCKPLLIPPTEMNEEMEGELDTAQNLDAESEIDFYLKNNIDFRGLIPMGLAYNLNTESNERNN